MSGRHRAPAPALGSALGAALVLALVAAAFVAAQAAIGDLRVPLDLDEAVYSSQFASDVPHFAYAAHRSVGPGLVVAPITAFTSSVTALRVYLAVLSGVALFFAFFPWRRLIPGTTAALAAALFAFSWVALRFGDTVLPNYLVALGAVAAIPLLFRDKRLPLFLLFAALSLIRPTDAVYLAIPLLAAALLRKKHYTALSLAFGLAAGWLYWVVESFIRFNGPRARLSAIAHVNDASGLHFGLPRYLAALNGKETCLPTASCGSITPTVATWWLITAALVAFALYTTRNKALLLTTVITALFFAASYLLLSNWAVPRYVLPTIALLSVPAAVGLMTLVRQSRVLAVAALALVALYIGVQTTTAAQAATRTSRSLTLPLNSARALSRADIWGNCAVVGRFAPQIAYLRRCVAADMRDGLHDAYGKTTLANLTRLQRQGLRVIVSTSTRKPRPDLASWRTVTVPGPGHLRLYLSPGHAARS
ncbi:hypothetical protein [Actinomadura barringtoniae]|uniref:hypothetical protein n=1 Tax=Actinomadura barringtoniae TaxID=1427535 RepID=UPI001FB616BD|nr:hypothetical protein [Actinomadura barringtoniae]